jgi:hypothetical protein
MLHEDVKLIPLHNLPLEYFSLAISYNSGLRPAPQSWRWHAPIQHASTSPQSMVDFLTLFHEHVVASAGCLYRHGRIVKQLYIGEIVVHMGRRRE